MRITESLSEEDAGEPPSLELNATHHNALLAAHDHLEIYPPYPRYSNATGEFECLLFDDYSSIEIKASLSGSLAERYKNLSVQERFSLEEKIVGSMGRIALGVMSWATTQDVIDDTVVLMNNLPVLFEPIDHAMLVGSWVNEDAELTDDEAEVKKHWDEWQKKKIHIRSQFIESYDQQRVLLSGLAQLVTYLEQQ
jgi:hypothetical protein